MKDKEQHIGWIRIAELQFRLACTVDVTVVNDEQSLEMADNLEPMGRGCSPCECMSPDRIVLFLSNDTRL